MSGTYKAAGGENWNDVARGTTGNDLDAAKIARANPGVRTPLLPGTVVQVPFEPPEVVEALAAKLAIKIDGIELGTFDSFALSMSIDAISKCGFSTPNEIETRELFRPLSNPTVTVEANGSRVFTGRAESPTPANSPDSRVLDISCYSLPGILERVPPPLTAFPLEFTRANLPAIAADLCAYHGIAVDFQADPGAVFERVDIKQNQMVLDFLSDLAGQRGPVITSGAAGELVFWNGIPPGNPIARYEKGLSPAELVSVTIDEDRYYSSVTGTIPAKSKDGSPGESFTVENPFSTDIVRPYTYEARNIDPGELETAVTAAAARMFAGVFVATLELSSWHTENGETFMPNRTIELRSPDDFINDFYEFLITDVVLSKSSGEERASVNLALPGVYSGELPEALPWDG